MARDLHHLTATLHLADPLQALGAEAGHGNVHSSTLMGSFGRRTPIRITPPASGPQRPSPRCINVQEAKTHLSALLLPLDPSPRRQLGFLQGRVDEAFF
jgi:hypothetical protein